VFVRVLVLRAASDKKGPEGEHEAGDREHVQHEEHQVVACKDSEQMLAEVWDSQWWDTLKRYPPV